MKLLLAITLLAVAAYAKDWAVIVAGSNGYYNYRHQSDACHAFQIVKSGGIAPENIIIMQYDDIANNPQNPSKGKLFNKPTPKGTPGVDVYGGCQKDYTGNDVTADNFINILTGNQAGVPQGHKVLKSNANDNVFVFFTDHGGTGIIAFPVGAYLQAGRLNDAIKFMNQKKMYSKLVFYLEACESGSMFENILPDNINVYVTTASNAEESSWGCYCPPDDVVNGVEYGSCLGDLYSVNWMENVDSMGRAVTLQDQFEIVKKLTTESHVMQYGDVSWTDQTIGDYVGNKTQSKRLVVPAVAKPAEVNPMGIVESRDIPMHLAYYAYLRSDHKDLAASHAAAQELINQVQHRIKSDNLFLALTKEIVGEEGFAAVFHMPAITPVSRDVKCFDAVNQAVATHCGGYTDYSLKYSRIAASLCTYTNQESSRIVETLKNLCQA
jgi:legumain